MTLGLADARRDAARLMPEMVAELRALVQHPSISLDGYPRRAVEAAGVAVTELMARSGFSGARLIDVPGGVPAVYADVPGPAGTPTVLFYAHFDVQPAPDGSGWESDPWAITERGGRLFGRGAADDKSGVILHAATMRLFDGVPPVGIKLIIEGEEEADSRLERLLATRPELFRADVVVSADNGNLVTGKPVLETTLRGDASCLVEVQTLERAVHSGLFGGAAPDALVALIHVLGGLWAEDGATIVPGLRRSDWQGEAMPEDLFRAMAGVRPGVSLAGSGTIASRLWSQPSVTVLGLDVAPVARAANILAPTARAKLGLRVAPDADVVAELDAVMACLRSRAPAWADVVVTPGKVTTGFVAPKGGRADRAARSALRDAFGVEPADIGCGGGIPLMGALQIALPRAEFVLWGAQDLAANAHGPNESVDPLEIERMIVSQALFLDRLAGSNHAGSVLRNLVEPGGRARNPNPTDGPLGAEG